MHILDKGRGASGKLLEVILERLIDGQLARLNAVDAEHKLLRAKISRVKSRKKDKIIP